MVSRTLSAAGAPSQRPFWIGIGVVSAVLWVPVLISLWGTWQSDPSLAHGPLIPVIAAGLLWSRRDSLGSWSAAAPGGLALLIAAALLHIAAVWADLAFLKPLSLVVMGIGGLWYLGGRPALETAIGPLCFLFYMIPWPTTLVEHLSFPLQLTSSAYAALFCGMMGLPIQREGVQLAVVPNLGEQPIYSILVARECSGLTSLMVLLAIGYLVAYHTPVPLQWRAALLAGVVPLALFANAVRLTLVLLAGAHHSAALAEWVHRQEAPVLIFLCGLGLIAIRNALLNSLRPEEEEEPNLGPIPASIR